MGGTGRNAGRLALALVLPALLLAQAGCSGLHRGEPIDAGRDGGDAGLPDGARGDAFLPGHDVGPSDVRPSDGKPGDGKPGDGKPGDRDGLAAADADAAGDGSDAVAGPDGAADGADAADAPGDTGSPPECAAVTAPYEVAFAGLGALADVCWRSVSADPPGAWLPAADGARWEGAARPASDYEVRLTRDGVAVAGLDRIAVWLTFRVCERRADYAPSSRLELWARVAGAPRWHVAPLYDDGAVHGDEGCAQATLTVDLTAALWPAAAPLELAVVASGGRSEGLSDVVVLSLGVGECRPGAACDDGDPCTANDGCDAGRCGGTALAACTCAGDGDCAPFDDADRCNGTLFCDGGRCAVAPDTVVRCTGAVGACEAPACDPASGACGAVPLGDGTSCDDGAACTARDRCAGGVCAGHERVCDDGDPCTADACDEAVGCVATPRGGACDDGDPCTTGDVCGAGGCVGEPDPACGCGTDEDCAPHDDDDRCNGLLRCVDGACRLAEDTVVTCAPPGEACRVAVCDPAAGQCRTANAGDGARCDDGDACTEADACRGGACAGTPVSCADTNPCTDDGCEAQKGCVFAPAPGTCDDGDPCTEDDRCEAGACVGDAAPGCGCTGDADCAPFDDGDRCNGGFGCTGGRCVFAPDSVVRCVQPDAECRRAVCEPATGACREEPLPDESACDDGDACTVGDACRGGACAGAARPCGDGDPCTDDGCDPVTGCVHDLNTAPCDDGNACSTGDRCVLGACEGTPGADCCTETADCAAFDDGDACTGLLVCLNRACVVDPATVVTCAAPAAECRVAACDPEDGSCGSAPAEDGTPCDDGDACTAGSACDGGACGGGAPVVDPSPVAPGPCRRRVCDPLAGWRTEPDPALEGLPCDDGDPCTGSTVCGAGACAGGAPTPDPAPADHGPCERRVCAAPGGWQAAPDPTADGDGCDDGDPCTTGTVCGGGACGGGATAPDPAPADHGPCETRACVAGAGWQAGADPTLAGTACDDGDACTAATLCDGVGGCAGTAVVCDDRDACTTDACVPPDGCVHTPASGTDCSSGDTPCATHHCQDGACVLASVASGWCFIQGTCWEANDAPGGVHTDCRECDPDSSQTSWTNLGGLSNLTCDSNVCAEPLLVIDPLLCGGGRCGGNGKAANGGEACRTGDGYLPDGVCSAKDCVPRCGGLACPALTGYAVRCNEYDACEYWLPDASGADRWDVWIRVPAGALPMGGPAIEGGLEAERPIHTVTFGAGFLVARYPIVVEQYAACVADGDCQAPAVTGGADAGGWGPNTVADGRAAHPQNGLTRAQAAAFCGWLADGGRLPSEAEWEYAATGTDHRGYPWGDDPAPSCALAVFDADGDGARPWGCAACTDWGCSGTAPVGAAADGVSRWGLLEQAGNVSEWVADCWHADYTGAPTNGSAWTSACSGALGVVRGGSFASPATDLRTAARAALDPAAAAATVGARCVRP